MLSSKTIRQISSVNIKKRSGTKTSKIEKHFHDIRILTHAKISKACIRFHYYNRKIASHFQPYHFEKSICEGEGKRGEIFLRGNDGSESISLLSNFSVTFEAKMIKYVKLFGRSMSYANRFSIPFVKAALSIHAPRRKLMKISKMAFVILSN